MKAAATKRFVLDASVAVAWCFEDEHTRPIMDLLDRVAETGAIAFLPADRTAVRLRR